MTSSASLGGSAATRLTERSGVWPFVLGSMLLGTVGVFAHQAGAAPATAVWFRCVFGLLGLTAWMAWCRQWPQLRLSRQVAPWVLASGVCMAASWLLFFAAMAAIPAGMAIVLFHVQPLWLLLFGALFLGEPIGRQRLLAVLTALLGLALATGALQHLPWLGDAPPVGEGYWMGVALCMVGAVVMAALTLCAKQARSVPASALAWWQCLVGAAVLWIGPLLSGWPAAGSSWLWLAGIGLVHTALAYSLIFAGTVRLPVARIAVLQYVYPAVAMVIDWAWLGQDLSRWQWLGMGVMALAIGYAERPRRNASAH